MSLARVGYGDIVPTTDVGKIFTVVARERGRARRESR
jgi:Ion channel